MTKKTALEFWNENEVTEIFVAGIGNAGGITYTQDLESEGEDYCDLNEVIENGLFGYAAEDENPFWGAEGDISEDGKSWSWNGSLDLHDCKGNSYTKITMNL